MFTSPGDIAFSLGSFRIHWYGLTMAFAMLCGLFAIGKIRALYYKDIDSNFVIDLAFYVLISGIIGARLYYVLISLSYFSMHPFEAFAIWQGGLSIHGAIMFGSLTGIAYTKAKKQTILNVADLFSFGLVVGQIIGRWGNFFNSEAFGIPTNLPWKLYVPIASRPLSFLSNEYFHPTFLYESIANLLVFVFLLIILNIKTKSERKTNGIIFFSYLICYGIIRFMIEKLRIDSVLNIFGMPIAEIMSLIFIIIGIAGLVVNRNK